LALSASGGASGMKRFIQNYKTETSRATSEMRDTQNLQLKSVSKKERPPSS
jgi:hypothetical protein